MNSVGYIYQRLRHIASKIFYQFKYPVTGRTLHKLKIHSIEYTLNKIIHEKVSVSRFGDGEFHWICMEGCSFQKCSDALSKRLKEVLTSHKEGHIVCIPQELASLPEDTTKAHRRFWKWAIGKYGTCWAQLLDFDREYYNTSISRLYIKYQSKELAEKWFLMWKMVWNKRDVLIIEGEKTRFGVENKLLDNARKIERIIAPSHDAFEKYDSIVKAGKQFGENKLILLALGPTATILAYDLAKEGFWAIDIGNLDIEYEWYISGTKRKVPVRGKYVYESGGDAAFVELDDRELEEYRAQIIAHV